MHILKLSLILCIGIFLHGCQKIEEIKKEYFLLGFYTATIVEMNDIAYMLKKIEQSNLTEQEIKDMKLHIHILSFLQRIQAYPLQDLSSSSDTKEQLCEIRDFMIKYYKDGEFNNHNLLHDPLKETQSWLFGLKFCA